MKLLLDTHTFLWFIGGSNQLSDTARALIEDLRNERLLSVASLWEMSIKASIGKLTLRRPFTKLIARDVEGNAIGLLEIRPAHLDTLSALPFPHRDPFDRLLIAHSLVEAMPIVGTDDAFRRYPVNLLW